MNDINLFLTNYLNIFPEEARSFCVLTKQIKRGENISSRKNFNGHVTISGLVILNDEKILVVLHKKLQKYLQPGGHIEKKDKNLFKAAEREIREETGLKNIVLHTWCLNNLAPVLIDTHKIPENKKRNENTHYHHDFMFIFNTEDENIATDFNEVSGFRWVEIARAIQGNSNVAKALKKIKKLKLTQTSTSC